MGPYPLPLPLGLRSICCFHLAVLFHSGKAGLWSDGSCVWPYRGRTLQSPAPGSPMSPAKPAGVRTRTKGQGGGRRATVVAAPGSKAVPGSRRARRRTLESPATIGPDATTVASEAEPLEPSATPSERRE